MLANFTLNGQLCSNRLTCLFWLCRYNVCSLQLVYQLCYFYVYFTFWTREKFLGVGVLFISKAFAEIWTRAPWVAIRSSDHCADRAVLYFKCDLVASTWFGGWPKKKERRRRFVFGWKCWLELSNTRRETKCLKESNVQPSVSNFYRIPPDPFFDLTRLCTQADSDSTLAHSTKISKLEKLELEFFQLYSLS